MANSANSLWTYTFDHDEMMKYLMDFDYISFKYGIKGENKYNDQYAKAIALEQGNVSMRLLKKSPSDIKENIGLVYGKSGKSDNFVLIYRLVMNKIIYKFLDIPGIERLYDEHFFEMEWDMHSRMNFKKHEVSFYRDHFVHQVRNLFEMCKLLDADSIYNHIEKVLSTSGMSKISYYISQTVNGIVYNIDDRGMEKKLLLDIFNNIYSGKDDFDTFLRKHYMRYIIYASSMLSALCHDIGYPIEHFLNLRERISEYLPILYMFINGDGGGFDRVRSILNESLLFTVVSSNEIKKRLFEKDHGAISAIAFLLQLYETGSIHSLPAEKRAAVELAGLTIYNHTIKYYFVSPGSETADTYYRSIMMQNPISYMLRLCDDVQEWERVYFEIQNVPSVTMCSDCKTPMIRKGRKRKTPNKIDNFGYEYSCRCNKNILFFKDIEFPSRSIITVSACNRLYVESNGNQLIFRFDYDQYKLLLLSRISQSFAKIRIKELNYIKKLVWGQNFGDYKIVLIDFAVSANPLILKRNIIGTCIDSFDKLSKKCGTTNIEDICAVFDSNERNMFIDLLNSKSIGVSIEDIFLVLNNIFMYYKKSCDRLSKAISTGKITGKTINDIFKPTGVHTNVNQLIKMITGMKGNVLSHATYNLMFYIGAYAIQSVFKTLEVARAKDGAETERDMSAICEWIERALNSLWTRTSHVYKLEIDETLKTLIYDLAEQTAKEQTYKSGVPSKSMKYYEEYMKSGDNTYMAVGKYCSEFYARNSVASDKYYALDYNTDLYLYHQLNLLNEEIKKKLMQN